MAGHQHLNIVTKIPKNASVVRRVIYCWVIETMFDGFLILLRFPVRVMIKLAGIN